jgi:hypothetical protein
MCVSAVVGYINYYNWSVQMFKKDGPGQGPGKKSLEYQQFTHPKRLGIE